MTGTTASNSWQNKAFIATRWMLIITMILASLSVPSEGDVALSRLILPAGVAIFGALIITFTMPVKSLIAYRIYLQIFADWLIAGAIALLANGNLTILLGGVGVLSITSLLYFGWQIATAEILGVVITGVMVTNSVQAGFTDELGLHTTEIIVGAALILAAMIWAVFQDSTVGKENRSIERLRREKDAEIKRLMEGTAAVAQMANTLSGTLSYDRILDSALDIGRLSLFETQEDRIVSVVMLYHAGEDHLQMANSRGLSLVDQGKSIAGKEGIVGKALEECAPIIGGPPKSDPELRNFTSFGTSNSMLCVPLRAGYDNYGVLIFASDAEKAFNKSRVDVLEAISTQATIALQNAVLYRNLLEDKDRIIEMEENGRKSLVRDLHDIPTQTISSLTMRIRIIQRYMEAERFDEANSELGNIEEMAQRATEEIRHVLFKLRPLVLESQGLPAALQQLAEKTQKTYNQNVAVRIAPNIERLLDEQAQGTIFYLVEEAVSNARKYAEADQINVALGEKNGVIILRIADNGKGFDLGSVTSNYVNRGSFGMVNMRERAEMLGGVLNIQSIPDKGTTITVQIPMPENIEDDTHLREMYANIPRTKLAASVSNRMRNEQAYRYRY